MGSTGTVIAIVVGALLGLWLITIYFCPTCGPRPSSEWVIERVVPPGDMPGRAMTCSDTAKACWTEE